MVCNICFENNKTRTMPCCIGHDICDICLSHIQRIVYTFCNANFVLIHRPKFS